jgi:hypothetical protein
MRGAKIACHDFNARSCSQGCDRRVADFPQMASDHTNGTTDHGALAVHMCQPCRSGLCLMNDGCVRLKPDLQNGVVPPEMPARRLDRRTIIGMRESYSGHH